MTRSPTVSVVLPVRDGGPWLAEAVGSILGQSWRDFELIVVDDGSRDGAAEALDRADPRLSVVPARGRGVVAAFDTGMALARGAFVARMDADDVALPRRLERQLALLRRDPAIGIAGALVEFFPRAGVGGGNRRYARWLNGLRTPAAIRRALFVESPIPNPTALFRVEVLRALGGYRDVDGPEDYDLFLRADAAGVAMAKPEGVLLRWREHRGRLTHTDARYALAGFHRVKAAHLAARIGGRAVLLWGAGPTRAALHDALVAAGVRVEGFVDVHPRRIGGRKRGLPVWAVERAAEARDALVLVAVGAPGARPEIRRYLREAGRAEGEDYLFVA